MTKPAPSTGMLSVYDGRRYLGAIIWRGRQGYAAFDAEDRTLGLYPDQQSAMRAVSAAATTPASAGTKETTE
jgi:hypothetical protein